MTGPKATLTKRKHLLGGGGRAGSMSKWPGETKQAKLPDACIAQARLPPFSFSLQARVNVFPCCTAKTWHWHCLLLCLGIVYVMPIYLLPYCDHKQMCGFTLLWPLGPHIIIAAHSLS